ncbi:hypothetical protein LMG24235_03031 [Paraburkholderia sabiae]|nr:hypothetical protein LMG24235_03031 [Paraburkholderia sabiae]
MRTGFRRAFAPFAACFGFDAVVIQLPVFYSLVRETRLAHASCEPLHTRGFKRQTRRRR